MSFDHINELYESLWTTASAAAQQCAAALSDLQQKLAATQHYDYEFIDISGSSDSSSRVWRRLWVLQEELLAYLRWSTPALQPNTHVPLPTQWDARTILAFLDCLRSLQHTYSSHTHDAAADAADAAADPNHQGDDGSYSSSGPSIPPVSAALVSVLLLVFTRPGGVALRDVALSPYCVLARKEYWRLFSCHLVHLDAAHLLTNLSALLPDTSNLEAAEGSAAAAADLLLLALGSSCAYVAAALLHKVLLGQPGPYYSLVTVGASSLGFALKVWSGYRCRGRRDTRLLFGLVPVPAQFAWVPSLALTHLLVPEASFSAHMAGVVAGLCRAYCMEPVLQGLHHIWHILTSPRPSHQQQKGRTLGVGAIASSSTNSSSSSRRQQGTQNVAWHSSTEQLLHSWRQEQHLRYLDSLLSPGSSDGGGGNSAAGRSNSGSSSGSYVAATIINNNSCSRGSSSSSRRWLRQGCELLLQLACVGGAVALYVACSSGSSSSSQQGRSSANSSTRLLQWSGMLW